MGDLKKKNEFEDLIKKYVWGWKDNDLKKILDSLSSDCIIIESHGPTYRGKEAVEKWFGYWLSEKGRVLRWDIKVIYYLENKNTAFFEWDFECKVSGKKHNLPGISVVKFLNNKISFIHEYRMTKRSYEWKKEKLMPE